MLNIKALPTRYQGQPVTWAAHIDDPKSWPHQAVIVTVDETSSPDEPVYRLVHLGSPTVDSKWQSLLVKDDMRKGSAMAMFQTYVQRWS